jgi:monofunctional glycosyltransferase
MPGRSRKHADPSYREAASVPTSSPVKRIIAWCRHHKIITLLILIVLYLLTEYILLPSSSRIALLKNAPPGRTALMEQRMDAAASNGRKFSIRQKWVPLRNVEKTLIRAVIVAEDASFYEHEGVDWYEVKESLKRDVEKWRFARGASTITQQLAKNLYLSTSKNPIRKVKEMIIAGRLEDELSKQRILELYLNVIEWGDGIFGVESASMTYFGKHASELSREEAVRLVAVIPSPLKHKPNVDSRFVNFRKRIILARLNARGW